MTNLPYAFAALPPPNPEEVRAILLEAVKKACGKEAAVMITDTDKTYSGNSTHITARPPAITGIRPMGLFGVNSGQTARMDRSSDVAGSMWTIAYGRGRACVC